MTSAFQARAGEITGYLGPNGSGKSTTMKMITGLMEMTSGEILFDGRTDPARPDRAYKQRMGYVPEEPHLYAHLSGLEYLVMVGQLRGLPAESPPPSASTACCGCSRCTATGTRPSRPIRRACGRRCCFRAALLHNPDLLLLDEPFSGLDVGTGLVLRSLIQELARARQSGAVQLARTGDRGARLLARRDPASRQDRRGRFHRAAARR